MINVGPGLPNPTHHVSLEDSRGRKVGLIVCDSQGVENPRAIKCSPVQRTAMKTTTGSTTYADISDWPWTPIAQSDFKGGRGLDDFSNDATRFFDSYRANTMFGTMYNGPKETYTKGTRSQDFSLSGSLTWSALLPGNRQRLAVKFGSSSNYNVTTIALWIRRRGTPSGSLTIDFCSDISSNPGTVLQSATITTTVIDDTVSVFHHVTIPAQSVTTGVPYWIVVYPTGSGDDSENNWQVGVVTADGTTKESADGSTWSDSDVDLQFRVTAAGSGAIPRLFRYKYMSYKVESFDGSAPRIWMAGDRGQADSNSSDLTKLNDATKSWTTNKLVGCVVQIISGPGSEEDQNWRTITANTSGSVTVDTAWKVAHTTATNYIIINADFLTEITGHGLTAKVTDIMVVNNIAYFAQGDSVYMRRMQYNESTGAHDWDVDGTNYASFLCTVRDTAGLNIWRANNSDGSSARSVSKASVAAWGTPLSFAAATDTTFKDDCGRITGICEYGSTKTLWVFREGSIFQLNDGKPDEIPLKEMRTMANSVNGSVFMVHNVYLYFNLGYGLERVYNSTLDDVGPNRDEGLPTGRQGPVSALLGYPGRYFVAIDGGSTDYSCVMCDNGIGFHEIYRAPMAGQRIRALLFEPIPGATLDRLWVAVGDDLVWLGFPSGTIYPNRDTAMRYTHESVLVTCWYTASLVDIPKIWSSVKLFAEDLDPDTCYIEVDYQIDQETGWQPLVGQFDTTPSQEIQISEDGITAKRIRLRIRMMTEDETKTARLKSLAIDAISREDVKYSWSFAYRVKDNDIDLNGVPDQYPYAYMKQDILNEWARTLEPLVAHFNYALYDEKKVYINPAPTNPIGEKSEIYIGQLSMVER
jgi:hypothetical protein